MLTGIRNRVNALRSAFGILEVGKKETLNLIALAALFAVFEGFGVGMLLPVLQYIEDSSSALAGSPLWDVLTRILETLGLPVTLGSLMALAFVPIILRQLTYFSYQVYSTKVMHRAESRLRVKGFGAIMKAELSFVTSRNQGDLVAALVSQVFRGGQAIQQSLGMLAAGVLIFGYVILLLLIAPQLTLIAVVVMLLVSGVARLNLKSSRRLGGLISDLGVQSQTSIAERISAIRLIKMRGQEDAESRKVADITHALEDAWIQVARLRTSLESLIDPIQMLGVFLVLYLGVEMLGATVASLGLFLFILLRVNGRARDFNIARQTFSSTIDSLEHVQGVIREATRSASDVVDGTIPFEGLRDRIEFSHVEFSYGDESGSAPVLKDVDLVIPKGSLTAIVGRSGAGKSTLVDLIPRLRDVTGGELTIDGVPVKDYQLKTLRRRIGFMTQDAILFNDTILNNLTYGLERPVTDEEIQAALVASYCEGFVSKLPQGVHTNVGDRGVRLSGGERQRLALARTFLQAPDILILDEPTSALDSESEMSIQQALSEIGSRMTMIVIAHRLSTVQRADQILVLEEGRIVERGTHVELLALDGVYRRLFELQIYG